MRASMQAVLIQPLAADLESLRHALRPEGVTRATLPEATRRSWVNPDGLARVELVPKAGQESAAAEFARAVMQAEPLRPGPRSVNWNGARPSFTPSLWRACARSFRSP